MPIHLYLIDGCWIISFMDGKKFTVQYLTDFVECWQQDRNTALKQLGSLHGILIPFDTCICIQNMLIMTKSVSYVDYSHTDTIQKDKEQEENLYRQGQYNLRLTINNDGCTSLDADRVLYLSSIIYAAFQIIYRRYFYGLYDVYQTCVPSCGARHPYRLYSYFPQKYTISGIYVYIPWNHCWDLFEKIDYGDEIIMGIGFDVQTYQIRYPYAAFYNSLLMEYGHILENIRIIGILEGFRINKLYSSDCLQELITHHRCATEDFMDFFMIEPQQKRNNFEALW